MKRLNCLIISFILVASLLSGVWLIRSSVSNEEVIVYFEPETVNVEPSQVFTVNVWVANVKNLAKWTLALSWNAKIIELQPASSSAVKQGSFLKNIKYFTVLPYTVESGYLSSISCELTQPVSGSGVLFSVSFKAKNKGETFITIESGVLYDCYSQKISCCYKQGYISVISTVHDLAVSLEAPANMILGESTLLNVSVANVGDIDEQNVLLKIFVNSKVWQNQTLALLRSGTVERFSFLWKPESKGIFNITAYIVPQPYESKIENNYKSALVNVVELVHDLAVLLDVPCNVPLGTSIMIKVTVKNIGAFDESNVRASLIISNVTGNVLVENVTIIELLQCGYEKIIIYKWEASKPGIYNVIASVDRVNGETLTANNRISKSLSVSTISDKQFRILIVADDDGQYYYKGTSLLEFERALQSSGYKYDVWKESTDGRPSVDVLSCYDLVIWTCGDFALRPVDLIDSQTLIEFNARGGKLLIEGERVGFEASTDFRSKILHVNYNGYLLSKSVFGISTICVHPITNGIGDMVWASLPYYQIDCVTPANGAFSVMRFNGIDSYFNATAKYSSLSAVTVYEGIDKGSVIYLAFALSNIPLDKQEILVRNCVEWLLREDIATVGSKILNAPSESIYFIYADPFSLSINETFGMVAGATVYGLCKYPQRQGFTSTKNWVAFGRINSTEINNTIVALFGSPSYHEVIKYYESNGLTPIRFCENNTHFMLLSGDGDCVISILKSNVERGLEDAFVIYSFRDGQNLYLVMYGFSWRSTWDSGKFFVDVISKNFSEFSQEVYIAKWDYNTNGYIEYPFPPA